ncbi:MAG: hypothetical protein NVS3B28_10580 [Candidatus Velthaea sp.]
MQFLAKFAALIVPLGIDTFAISIAVGFNGLPALRAAFVFTLFEMFMPLIGIVGGAYAGARFEYVAALAGGAILVALGINAFREAAEEGADAARLSFATMRSAALAGVAISIDELAVGFPIGTSHLPVAGVIGAIGLQTFAVTIAGIALGRRIGRLVGARAVRISGSLAGTAFIGVGVWLIAERVLLHR